jgi:hypothetical protein
MLARLTEKPLPPILCFITSGLLSPHFYRLRRYQLMERGAGIEIIEIGGLREILGD